jgi:mono/diheme cytochrome c family protein
LKPWSAIALSAPLIAAGAIGAAGLVALRGGISARPEPSAVEAALARRVRHLAVPAAAQAMQNPVPSSVDGLRRARAHFADHCASCHGDDGKGATEMGRGLYPRSPDLTAPATQELSDGELFYVIENGIRFTGMPGWGGAGRPEESWELVRFIRQLPQLGVEEVREMERMNPRSPAEWKELEEEDQFLGGASDGSPSPPGHQH